MTRSRLQLLLDLADPRIQVVHEILLFSVGGLPLRLLLEGMVCVFDLPLQIIDLLLILLDHFLTEVRSLGQLLLNLFVVLQVLRQVRDHALHLMVLEHEVFRALRLIVEFGRQLHILDHSQLRCTLQLVLIGHRVLHSHCSDLHQHVLSQLVDLLDPVLLDTLDQVAVHLLLILH